jgi:hypothetical protein
MNVLIQMVGAALVVWSVVEAVWTALWPDGHAGPLTHVTVKGVWALVRSVVPRGAHRALSLSGPLTFVVVLVGWVTMLWLGWGLVFYSDPTALADPRSGSRPSLTGTLWFSSYMLFTVGNGDFSPREGAWQLAASAAAGSGIMLVTLSVTYVLQVLGAVVGSRALSSQILGLGKTPEALLLSFWDGKRFASLDLALNTWSSQLSRVADQHQAYPILHFYHPAAPEYAHTLAIAVLDEALSLVAFGVAPECRPAPGMISSARAAVKSFLDTMAGVHIRPAEEPPTPPDLSPLAEAGVPVVARAEFDETVGRHVDRRRKLLGMVADSAWTWPGRS